MFDAIGEKLYKPEKVWKYYDYVFKDFTQKEKYSIDDIDNLFKDNQNFPSEEIEKILNDIIVYKKHWLKYCSQVAAEKRTIAGFKSFIALGKTQDNSNNKGVALLTAHMSKGLQFDVVFIISACEGVFPDYRAIKSKGKDLEQEKNNMFVAVTRAKRLCYISYPRYRMMPWGDCKKQEPSRYISTQIINNFQNKLYIKKLTNNELIKTIEELETYIYNNEVSHLAHYTSPEGLESIIKYRTLIFTHSKYLKDKSEGELIYELLDSYVDNFFFQQSIIKCNLNIVSIIKLR